MDSEVEILYNRAMAVWMTHRRGRDADVADDPADRDGSDHAPPILPIGPLGHVPTLDGLRGFAVLAVFGIHLYSPIFSGGDLGVDLFFVLSGFLITKLLYEEWDRSTRLDLRDFYLRRLFRLQPAMAVLLAVVLLASFTAFAEVGGLVRTQVLYTALLSGNLYALGEGFAGRPLLGHTWSLGLEEQFYLVWPFLLALIPSIAFRAPVVFLRRLAVATFVSIVVGRVVVLGILDYPHWGSIPFFNFDGLALGCMLAVYLHTTRGVANLLNMSALRLCMVLIAVDLAVGGRYKVFDEFELRRVVLRLIFAYIVFAAVVTPDARPLAWLHHRTLAYFGKISYSLYLWHIPVFNFFDDDRILGSNRVVLMFLKISISLLLAVASFNFVERPMMGVYRHRFASTSSKRRSMHGLRSLPADATPPRIPADPQ